MVREHWQLNPEILGSIRDNCQLFNSSIIVTNHQSCVYYVSLLKHLNVAAICLFVCLFVCFSIVCNNGDIRLAGSSIAGRGRVEICWNQVWGTVCDDLWSSFDATVACRQLGFTTTGKQTRS